jgi:hypothetical protein
MIFLFWRGFGFLVFVFVFGFSLIANIIVNSATGGKAYWNTHKWPFALSLFFAAASCWFLGQFLSKQKTRLLIDPKSGEEVVIRKTHTFFAIPMIWWCPILAGWGLIELMIAFHK